MSVCNKQSRHCWWLPNYNPQERPEDGCHIMPLSDSAAPKLSHTRLLLMTGAAPLVLALVLALALELILAPLLSSPWTGGAVRGGNSLVAGASVNSSVRVNIVDTPVVVASVMSMAPW